VAILRIEQLYPLADELLIEALGPYKDAELVWVQEEPFNMGAWYHLNARWPAALGKLACVSRPESASPATGSEKSHKYEQQLLMDQAFGEAPLRKP
jgi:2-oxoglutarate dehydrogenase E1 component